MNETIRQRTTAQPQRQVGGSVPVLFSVRNVQPKIVGSIAQPKPTDSSVNDVVSTSPNIASTPTDAAASAAKPMKAPPSSSNNRTYNVAVGLLVIALCLLVIRNTQSSKPDSKESIASNAAVSPADVKPLANVKVELVPPALPSPPPLKPFDLEMAAAPNKTPVFSTVSNTSEVAESAVDSQPSVASNPPMLLNSQAPSTPAQIVEPVAGTVVHKAVVPPLGFPATTVATNPVTMESNGSMKESIELGPSNSAPIPNSSSSSYRPALGNTDPALGQEKAVVLDTSSPTLATRDLYEMSERYTSDLNTLIERRKSATNSVASNAMNGQPYVEPTIRATTVSNAAPVSNTAPVSSIPPAIPNAESVGSPSGYKPLYSVDQAPRDPSIMTGRSYSTSPQEFPSLTVPSYERDANVNRNASQAATQNSVPIRQPSTKDANRYPATTQTPYSPLPPVQNGSSFGYPPGK